jgi:2-methylcitrate dehydratase PrpD
MPSNRKEIYAMGQITDRFSELVIAVQYSDLPNYVVHEMKRVILDSIGCAILGRMTERGRITADLARKFGGPCESSVIGTKNRVSCTNAAFANGESTNALDFDAISHVGRHDTPSIVSATLALGESIGVSGKELILATALAFEISARIKSASGSFSTMGSKNDKIPWPAVSAVAEGASLGAAAGCCKMMGLTQEGISNAIGIAGYICPPSTMRKFMDTAPVKMVKYGPSGWAAQAGITAAKLAELGYTGDTDLFDGEYGFWRYMGKNKGEWDGNKVLRSLDNHLGKRWLAHKMCYKQYPCGY